MAKVNLQIKTTDVNDKNQTTTISYANPNASDQVLKTFAQKIVALSTDMYRGTDKVETTNLDTESSKSVATITLSSTSITTAALKTTLSSGAFAHSVAFTYSGDGTVYAYRKNTSPSNFISCFTTDSSGTLSLILTNALSSQDSSYAACEIVVFAPETANYKAAQATFTVTD